MEPNYTFPSSDETTLYLDGDGSYTLYDILERATDHFEKSLTVDCIHITSKRIKVMGCSCCRSEPNDWSMYLVVTLVP